MQIGAGLGGMKPLTQNGKVHIVEGELVLYSSHGQVIDRAPVTAVSARKAWYTMGSVAFVTLGEGRRYSVAVKVGGAYLLAGTACVLTGRAGNKRFLRALKEEQHRYADR
ncbi:hypothetical protein GCM10009753_70530 [Streptantibioticus ferralitis]